MHHFEDKVPIHSGPVDILQFDCWTRCVIGPVDVTADKILNIRCSRQFFHQRHFTPDTNHPFHMGDLPNITVGAAGTGTMNVYTTRVTMGGPTGLFDADGSAIIIHANLDPGVGGPNGSGISGGARIGCGVIER